MDYFKIDRKQYILDELKIRPAVSVAELAKIFKVSEVTIRKDLKELDHEGHLTRTHGGATNLVKMGFESIQSEKEQLNIQEKKAIADLALELVQDGDSIMMDAGSTTVLLARRLRTSPKRITVVTNSFNIANELVDLDHIELIMVGGIFRKGIYSCVGPIAESIISGLHVDKCFLGINSIDIERGLTTANLYEAEVKRKMLASGKERFLLTDHTKFGQTSLSAVCSVKELDCIITDDGIDSQYLAEIEKMGTKVLIAESKP